MIARTDADCPSPLRRHGTAGHTKPTSSPDGCMSAACQPHARRRQPDPRLRVPRHRAIIGVLGSRGRQLVRSFLFGLGLGWRCTSELFKLHYGDMYFRIQYKRLQQTNRILSLAQCVLSLCKPLLQFLNSLIGFVQLSCWRTCRRIEIQTKRHSPGETGRYCPARGTQHAGCAANRSLNNGAYLSQQRCDLTTPLEQSFWHRACRSIEPTTD
jgi:hypothetical protein